MVGAAGPLSTGTSEIRKARNLLAQSMCAVRFRALIYCGRGRLVGHNRAQRRVVQQVAAQA